MLRIKLSCLIFTFLCVVFSSKAQTEENPRVMASLCERDAYYAKNPIEFNEAIWAKSIALEKAGDYAASLNTLNRVRLYAVPSERRQEIGVKKSWLAYMVGDYDTAMSFLQEVGVDITINKPSLKNEWLAMGLTFIVPAGFIYVEEPLPGAEYTALNALAICGIVCQIMSKCYISGILGGAMALNVSFMGAQEKVALLLLERNSKAIKEAKKEALNSFFQVSSEGRTARLE